MIDLYRTKNGITPNIYKVIIFLEEAEMEYRMIPVNLARGEQFDPKFLAISPNNKVPAIIDHEPADGGAPLTVFESGAILTYLADKCGRFLPPTSAPRARSEVTQWLFWQVAGFGPHWGGWAHYTMYAREKIPYAAERHRRELDRLFGVLDGRLAGRRFICGDDYTIADIINFATTISGELFDPEIAATFPNFWRWSQEIRTRPAVVRAFDPVRTPPDLGEADASGNKYANDELAMKIMFEQTSRYLRGELPTQ